MLLFRQTTARCYNRLYTNIRLKNTDTKIKAPLQWRGFFYVCILMLIFVLDQNKNLEGLMCGVLGGVLSLKSKRIAVML